MVLYFYAFFDNPFSVHDYCQQVKAANEDAKGQAAFWI
jgi:hypothetical protein